MDRERYQRLKHLFHRACELTGSERADFIARECGDDAELSDALCDMLEVEGTSDDALARALHDGDVPVRPTGHPERIADYRVIGLCGHGGMGTVFEAEHVETKRRVAVKIISAGRMHVDSRRRFRREAEVLARLDHPGIAEVVEFGDAEVHGGVVPFLAMEYVTGASILRHAEEQQLDLRARVELFCDVCDAAQHAHEQGVIHRDLKPDNILVVAPGAGAHAGRAKVLDFGVARLSDRDASGTLVTGTGQLVGSLSSMSPEQARGGKEPTDARSDVYALGMVLYELLAGELPYRVADRPLADVLDAICHAEPTPLGRVVPQLDGDLETIVGTCLEKDPAQRYASASALAADLRRFVRRAPIVARRRSSWERVQRFVARHRGLVAATLAVVVALSIGLALAVGSAFDAARSEGLALVEAHRANLSAAQALATRDPRAARRALEAVPVAQRGWEWHHVAASLSRALLDFGRHVPGTPLVVVDDGAHVVSGLDARRLALWDVETGDAIGQYAAPDDVTAWAVSPDGRSVAAGLVDGSVVVAERSELSWQEWLPAGGTVEQIVFAPSGVSLAVVRSEELVVGTRLAWERVAFDEGTWPREVAFTSGARQLVLVARRPYDAYIKRYDAVSLALEQRRPLSETPLAFTFAPRTGRVLVGTDQRAVLEIDVATLERSARRLGHTEPVIDVAVHDGRMASAAEDGTVHVWGRDGVVEAVLEHDGVHAVDFVSADRLVSASPEGIRLWDLGISARRVLGGHGSYVYDVAFSADGERLAANVPYNDAHIAVWNVLDGRLLARDEPSAWLVNLAFGRDERLGLGRISEASAYDWATGVVTPIDAPTVLAISVSRSSEGRRMSTLDVPSDHAAEFGVSRVMRVQRASSGALRLWNDGAEVALESEAVATFGEWPRLFLGAAGDLRSNFVGAVVDVLVYRGDLESGDAAAIEAALQARMMGEREAIPRVEPELVVHFEARASQLVLESSDDGADDRVRAWRASNSSSLVARALGAPIISYEEGDASTGGAVAFKNVRDAYGWFEMPLPQLTDSDDVTMFVSGRFDAPAGRARSVMASLGSVPRALCGWDELSQATSRLGVGEALSRDRRRYVGAYRGILSPTAVVRDVKTGVVLGEYGERVYGVAFDATGRHVALALYCGDVEVWDVDEDALVVTIPAHESEVYAVAWSPDGTRLVTGGNDNTIGIWDVATWTRLLELRGHGQYVKAVAFSPDGTRLASASGDGTVSIWHSTSAAARHAERSAARQRENDVRDDVETLWHELGGAVAVAREVRTRWAGDAPRRAAALTVLSELRAVVSDR